MSQAKAASRLEHLTRTQWRGQPLAELLARSDGLNAYIPRWLLVTHEESLPLETVQPNPICTPGREAVIA